MVDLSKSHWMKTCPNCSRRAGYLVWLPYPEAFGQSVKRDTQEHHGAQSWCVACRREKERHDARKRK